MLQGAIAKLDRVEVLRPGKLKHREGFVQASGMMAYVELDPCISGKEKRPPGVLPFNHSELKLKAKFISGETE